MSRWAFRFCSHAWIGLFPSQEGCSLPVRETESEVPTFLTLCFSLLTLFWCGDTPRACGHGERRDLFCASWTGVCRFPGSSSVGRCCGQHRCGLFDSMKISPVYHTKSSYIFRLVFCTRRAFRPIQSADGYSQMTPSVGKLAPLSAIQELLAFPR